MYPKRDKNIKLPRMPTKNLQTMEELQKSLYKILGMVGHDISTPITVMDQYFGLLRDGLLGPVDPKQKQALDVMQNHSDRLKKIMADLERITSWDVLLQSARRNFRDFDLWECVEEVVAELQGLYESKQMSVEWNTPRKTVMVNGHRDSIKSVITHLLVNAYKFTPPGTKVVIAIQENVDTVNVCVEDNGKGIKPETLPHIFDSFYVGTDCIEFAQNIPKHISSRLGLGLAIAKNIIESHSGKIWAESEWEKFARFHFVLPKKRGG